MMPTGPMPVTSRFNAMNWLAPATTTPENRKVSSRLTPLVAAGFQQVKAVGAQVNGDYRVLARRGCHGYP